MRPLRVTGFALAVVLSLAGCPKQGSSSPAFTEGRDKFNALYGKHLEDAYAQPEMDEVVAKLEEVPQDSSDFQTAQELLKRISSGRERLEAQAAERAEMIDEATRPTSDFAFTPEPDAGVREAEAPDAGADAEHPQVGMALSEVTRRFGDCFLPGEEIEVRGRGLRPSWEMRDTAYCRKKHAGYEARVLILEGDVIFAVAQKSRLEKVQVDAGTPAPPAPGTGAGESPQNVPTQETDAG